MSVMHVGLVVVAIVQVDRGVVGTLVRVGIGGTHWVIAGTLLLLRAGLGLIMLLAHQGTEGIRGHTKGSMTELVTRVLTAWSAEATATWRRDVLSTTKSSTPSGMLFVLLLVGNGFQT
jgi:hypothetical protein